VYLSIKLHSVVCCSPMDVNRMADKLNLLSYICIIESLIGLYREPVLHDVPLDT